MLKVGVARRLGGSLPCRPQVHSPVPRSSRQRRSLRASRLSPGCPIASLGTIKLSGFRQGLYPSPFIQSIFICYFRACFADFQGDVKGI